LNRWQYNWCVSCEYFGAGWLGDGQDWACSGCYGYLYHYDADDVESFETAESLLDDRASRLAAKHNERTTDYLRAKYDGQKKAIADVLMFRHGDILWHRKRGRLVTIVNPRKHGLAHQPFWVVYMDGREVRMESKPELFTSEYAVAVGDADRQMTASDVLSEKARDSIGRR
jgi:hypothetical protein